MRLPNGYGSITKLQGNRRRPYMVRITMGFTDEGKQIMKALGYYATRKEALGVLADYNDNPYNPADKAITFAKVWEKFLNEKYISKGKQMPYIYTAAFQWCKPVHDMPFCDVKYTAIQHIIDTCSKGRATKRNIKILYNKLSDYCIANGIIKDNYARFIELPPEEASTKHTVFTPDELATLWEYQTDSNVQLVLILCYTGMRPSELLNIKSADVHIEERYLRGGLKTAAGKNRIIPIALKILPFIKRLLAEGGEYLVIHNGKRLTYSIFQRMMFDKAMELAALKHLAHDGRHTCATMLNNAGVSDVIIKKILGHKSRDITEKVYTHKTIQQLIDAIDLI